MTTSYALRAGRTDRPYFVLALLQVLDVLTTAVVLHVFAGNEGNPVARVLTNLEAAGLIVLLVVKLAVVYSLWRKQTGVRLVSALYSLVIVNNVLALLLAL